MAFSDAIQGVSRIHERSVHVMPCKWLLASGFVFAGQRRAGRRPWNGRTTAPSPPRSRSSERGPGSFESALKLGK
eukprot:9122714-Pyramimonas_sp.AAC.1